MLLELLNNHVLGAGLLAWWLAQILKPFTNYPEEHSWKWGLWFSSGGMPSSHSSLITAVTLSTGFQAGFDSPTFALAFAISMVVIYDAAGVRREAGLHAEKLNLLINEFFSGRPLDEKVLKEVIGHTPRQVIVGVFLGLFVAIFLHLVWH